MVSLADVKHQMEQYHVILTPDKDKPDWWAGAPSIAIKDDIFYLAARMREAESPRGQRGYEIRILKSIDGKKYRKVKTIHRKDTDLPGFERPSLIYDKNTSKFKLYGCGQFPEGWGIWKLDDVSDPVNFDPSTLKPVLLPEIPEVEVNGAQEHHATFRIQYKDPFIFYLGIKWHMFVIGFDRVERAYHLTSNDGDSWEHADEQKQPILDNTGWHNFFTRPACLLPLDIGYLLVYEGSNIQWTDPGYNIATGLAYGIDLNKFIDLTNTNPVFKTSTPGKYHTWRYSHWLKYGGKIFVYYEAARENGSNEIRLSIIEDIVLKS